MEKWENNNKPMRRKKSDFLACHEEEMWPVSTPSRLFWPFFPQHTVSWAHYRLIVEYWR
jgi:hypothetical protein